MDRIMMNKKRKRCNYRGKFSSGTSEGNFSWIAKLVLVAVVFVSVMALFGAPAQTLEQMPVCGFEEHTHGEDCQKAVEIIQLNACNAEIHQHSQDCYAGEALICGQADFVLHRHDGFCYSTDGELICGIGEFVGHIHEQECYCKIMAQETETDCDVSEDIPGPAPEEFAEYELMCEISEVPAHAHGEGCYDTSGVLSCGVLQLLEHQHSEQCITREEVIHLDCSRQEHYHTAQCFSDVNEEENTEEGSEEADSAGFGEAFEEIEITEDTTQPEETSVNVEANEIRELSVIGQDYRIEVRFTEAANLPEGVELAAEEILPGSADFAAYYEETMKMLPAEDQYTFCRFFNISFLSNGIEVEPEAPVEVNIFYDQKIEDTSGDCRVIHFAEEGAEILDAQLDVEGENGSSFEFTQESFSVVGTIVMPAAVDIDGYWQKVNAIDDTSAQYLLVYEGDSDYTLGVAKSGTSYKVAATTITLNKLEGFDDVYTCNAPASAYLWSFGSTVEGSGRVTIKNASYSKYINLGASSLIGNSASCTLTYAENGYWTISGSNRYLSFSNGSFSRTSAASSAARLSIYKYTESLPGYTIWLDGTNGNNVMQLKGSNDTSVAVTAESNYLYTLPESWPSPGKYSYRLSGWYDIYSGSYYAPGETVQITQNTVFYADWVAQTYDVGQDNEHVVGDLDTSRFITTRVFDYGVLFNAMSANPSGTVTSDSHTETWSLVTSGPVKYRSSNTLGITFRDWDAAGKSITYAKGYDDLLSGGLSINNNHGKQITSNIIATSNALSGGGLIHTFFGTGNSFNPADKTGVLGKTYLGLGNYLYQYMDAETASYDGTHNGYYYYDSRLNAASYNQSNQRFYVYDYLERTSDSLKDGGAGANSDFLPFNSPYANTNGKSVNTYSVNTHSGANYQYDAKYSSTEGGVSCTTNQAGTNYGFGISSDISFYLPAASGEKDAYGHYINQSISGQELTFEFSGDDDVWVYVDDVLVLDIGGLHGIITGSINFSTGKVIAGDTVSNWSFGAGEHKLTFCYLERGGSQSNCAIYFNIAPRYSLDITKIDLETKEKLAGAEFSVYTDELCTISADQLWTSKAAHDNYENPQSTFVCGEDGVAHCWGLVPGGTYYIKETKTPEGVPRSDSGGIVKVSLNANGRATYEAVKVSGTDSFTVEGFTVDSTKKALLMGITNQREEVIVPVYTLPETGGTGHGSYIIIGSGMTFFFLLLIFTKAKLFKYE